jgi:hypothetical protein
MHIEYVGSTIVCKEELERRNVLNAQKMQWESVRGIQNYGFVKNITASIWIANTESPPV